MTTKPAPHAVTLTASLTSGVVLLSALAMIAACLFLAMVPPWSMLGFEVVVALACVLGVLNSRFRSAPALTLLCVASCVFAGSVLGYVGVRGVLDRGNEVRVALKPWLVGRLAAAALLVALAAWTVLRRDRRAVALALRAAIWALPVVIAGLLAAGVLAAGPGTAVMRAIEALPGWARAGTYLILGLVLAVSLCASGHFLIRAFEIGTESPGTSRPSTPKPSTPKPSTPKPLA